MPTKSCRMRTMPAMPTPVAPVNSPLFYRALAVSLVIHGLLLLLPQAAPPSAQSAATPLQASLSPRHADAVSNKETVAAHKPGIKAGKPSNKAVINMDRPGDTRSQRAPTFNIAQKAEMDDFLNELADEARRKPPPTLAQRALAMAREAGREMARADESGEAMLELRPNAQQPNPFSLDFYLEGLLRRLNRSANFVNNERRHKGIHTASVQFRLNPDGSLKSFVVLNAADQADEIAYIKAVVERSVPFSPFPPDIDKAARSLGVTICIRPGSNHEPGFSRMQGGRCV